MTSATAAPADRLTNSGETPTTAEGTAMTTPDITGAIAQAQDVFGSVPAARQALEYLSATLAAEAEARAADEWRERALKAEAALAGGANASIAEETHTSAGEAPVAGGAFDQAAAEMAAESAQKFADAERGAARAGTAIVDLVVKIDTSAIDVALALVDQLKAALASVAPAGLSISVADLGPLETRTFPAGEVLFVAPQSAPAPAEPA